MTAEERTRALEDLRLRHAATVGEISFHGNSMLPFLRDGDGLAVDPVAPSDVRIGDIVVYRLDDRFPVARVVGRDGARLRLRCDNWPFAACHIWPADLLGRVTARKRAGHTLPASGLRWRIVAAGIVLRTAAFRIVWSWRSSLDAWRRRVRRRRTARRHGLSVAPVAVRIRVGGSDGPPVGPSDRRGSTGTIAPDAEAALRAIDVALPPLEVLELAGWGEGWTASVREERARALATIRSRRPATRLTVEVVAELFEESVARDLATVPVDQVVVRLGWTDEPNRCPLARTPSPVLRALAELDRVRSAGDGRRPRVSLAWSIPGAETDEWTARLLASVRRIRRSRAFTLVQSVVFDPEDADVRVLAGATQDAGHGGGQADDRRPVLHGEALVRLREAVKLAERDGMRIVIAGSPGSIDPGPPRLEVELDGSSFAVHDRRAEAGPSAPSREHLGDILRSGFREIWESAGCAELRRSAARPHDPSRERPLATSL